MFKVIFTILLAGFCGIVLGESLNIEGNLGIIVAIAFAAGFIIDAIENKRYDEENDEENIED
ncbi:MAG: hypothetical protein R3Y32_08590 [Bacillota bacterium]